jgi:methionyl-tRNA formyltransferase
MKVLVLGVIPSPASRILKKHGCDTLECDARVDVDFLRKNSIDFAVSYRYRYMIWKPIIEYLKGNIINLHISLLPWNRGADPNLWSFLEDTPKGVTIHYVDECLDTGDIIVQKEVFFDYSDETLATTYQKLNEEILELFKCEWPSISAGRATRQKQPMIGSFHSLKDRKKIEYLLAERGWDTPVITLVGKAGRIS